MCSPQFHLTFLSLARQRCWDSRKKFVDGEIDSPIHLGDDAAHIPLRHRSSFGNSIGPHRYASRYPGDLCRHCNFHLDPGIVIHLLQLFQFPAENVVIIRTPVINRDHGELTAGAQMIDDGASQKRARICRPAVIFVEADFLRRPPVDDRPLP